MKPARSAALTAATVSAMRQEGTDGFMTRVAAVPRMLRDTATGEYDGLGKGRLFAMLLAVAYVLSPVDLLPEAILTIPGLVDDAAIAVWLLAAVMSASDDYLKAKRTTPIFATATVVEDPAYPRRAR